MASTKVTWLGHSCWWIEQGEHRILIDPFLTDNPAAKTKPSDLYPTAILISHGHFDHIADAVEIAHGSGATVVSNYEIASWLSEKHHVSKTVGMNLGGWAALPFGKVKLTMAWHSSVLPDGTYGGAPGGFLIKLDGVTIYYAGDTALFSDLSLLAKERIDLAILPIGDLFTMGPVDSVDACSLLQPLRVLPTHYNTWPPIAQDANAWAERVRAHTAVQPHVLEVNESLEIA